jgi:hypothetical protein
MLLDVRMPYRIIALAALPLTATILISTAPAALAQGCLPDSPQSGDGVVCVGEDLDGFEDGSEEISIVVEEGALVTSPNSDAMRVDDIVTIDNFGRIEATETFVAGETGDEGIQGDDDLVIFNATGATIFGGKTGIAADNDLDLENEGTISSTNEGVEAGDRAFVGNFGLIEGGDDAVQVGEDAEIINDGDILSTDGDGIDMDSGLVLNSGTIATEGEDGAGIDFDPSFGSDKNVGDGFGSEILNFGTIRGGSGILVETGEGGARANTSTQLVDNFGTIEGTGGVAVNLGAGDDSYFIAPFSKTIGDVLLGSGDDTLVFVGDGDTFLSGSLFDGGDDFDVVDFFGYAAADTTILSFEADVLTLSLVGEPFGFEPLSVSTVLESFEIQLANFELFGFDDGDFILDDTGTAFLRNSVAPVPLPAGAWLLLGGLGALGALRARRRSRA